jgi:hypothetical protein
MMPSQITVNAPNKPLYISTDFIGIQFNVIFYLVLIMILINIFFKEVKFEAKMFIDSTVIFETYHPGGVCEIYAFDYVDERWVNVWSVFDDMTLNSNQKARCRPTPFKAARRFEPILKRTNIYSEYDDSEENNNFQFKLV